MDGKNAVANLEMLRQLERKRVIPRGASLIEVERAVALRAKKYRPGSSLLTASEEKELSAIETLQTDHDSAWAAYSQPVFSAAKTFDDLLFLGSLVSQNRLVAPWYPALFVGGEDNPLLTWQRAQVFAEINRRGVLTIDSQEGSTDQRQRAYLVGLTRVAVAQNLSLVLNLIPGIIAYWHLNKTSEDQSGRIRDLAVTYDPVPVPVPVPGGKKTLQISTRMTSAKTLLSPLVCGTPNSVHNSQKTIISSSLISSTHSPETP
jgi:hypothetical protein